MLMFILIVTMNTSHGPVIQMQEFSSKASCETAASYIKKDIGFLISPHTVCVENDNVF